MRPPPFAMSKTLYNNAATLNLRVNIARPRMLYKAKRQNLRKYRIILSADTASEVRQLLSQKRR